MDQGFSILMLCFAAVLLVYAALMAITKDYRILPYRSQVSVNPKNPNWPLMTTQELLTALEEDAI